METTMRKRNVTNKLKLGGVSVLSAAVLASGGYVLGNSVHSPASADVASISSSSSSAQTQLNQRALADKDLIVSAIDSYNAGQDTQNSVSYTPLQVYDVQVSGSNARAHETGGDSGGMVYLHYSAQSADAAGKWSVVYAGQTPPTQAVADQYGLPSSWTQVSSW